ncbi:MAG: putative N-terminal nucleophile aminohydrolase, partial [Streblomastix strix]
MEYNGSAILAMAGNKCVSIASDLTFQVQREHIGRIFKVYHVSDRILLGLTGLLSDCITFYQKIRYELEYLRLKENRELEPRQFMNLVCYLLYKKRFSPYFIEAVIAGIDENGESYVGGTDTIGCATEPKDFIVSGTTTENLLGPAESFWEDKM